MSFRIAINRPILKPRRYTTIAQTRTETSNSKTPGTNISLIGRLDQEYGNRFLQVLLSCYNASTPIDTFNRIYFFVIFFPIIWFAIVSDAVVSVCRMSRYPIITILLSEVFLLTCLAKYTAVMILLSTTIGTVALLAHPMAEGGKILFLFVNDRLSNLENYFSQRTGSLETLLEHGKMLIPIWVEDADWCQVTQSDDLKRLPSNKPALLPPPLGKSKVPPPRILPKVIFKVQPQVQKPDFDPEGWLLV